jgi:UDP-N-acetylglucosamine acyltransferase
MARIHSLACVESAAVIADDAEIGPFCVIGPHVRIGAGCRLLTHVHIMGHTTVGERTIVYPYASLGAPPQSTRYRGGPTQLIIGADNEIRENVTMSTGTEDGGGVTRVGNSGTYMVGAHIAHDCNIGDGVTLANGASLAGHCEIADHAVFGGMAGLHQGTRVGERAMIGAMSAIRGDVIPYGLAVGNTAHLNGLNVVGLRRAGASGDELAVLKRAYHTLFDLSQPMPARLHTLESEWGSDPRVQQIVQFVRDREKRPLCYPRRRDAGE